MNKIKMNRHYSALPDDDLAFHLSQGDNAAFEEIFNRYWLKLYNSAFKRVKSREKAEEIVQDIFTLIWAKRDSIKIHTSLSAYLYSAVKHLILNHFAREKSREKYLVASVSSRIYDNSTECRIFLNDLQRNIERELRYLPPKCRSVFELSRKHYKSNSEIAESLGISEKTVEGHLTRAIRYLRLSLGNINSFFSWFL